MKDCLFLVADGAMETVLRAFLERPRFMEDALGCRRFTFDMRSLVNDSGVLDKGVAEARRVWDIYERFVLMLDSDFDDRRATSAEALRSWIEERVDDEERERIAVIVIEPELENWVWAENSHVIEAFQLDRIPDFPGKVRSFLATQTYPPKSKKTERRYKGCWGQTVWPDGTSKPPRPKEAAEYVCELNRLPRSNALYKQIAERMSVKGCTDPAFDLLRKTLRAWFPPEVAV